MCKLRHCFSTAIRILVNTYVNLSACLTISTFYPLSLGIFRSRTRIPSWGGYGDARLLRGPLRLAPVSLSWLTAPLLPGAQESTLHIAPGPSQCNMSGMWNILRAWVFFCGHVCGRSLLLIQTSCGTRSKTRRISIKTNI